MRLAAPHRRDDAVLHAGAARASFRRCAKPGLIVRQIYNAGARSLVIIMLSGLFVGMVLGLLGFDMLQRFGSEDSLGVLAALGMLKVLGPVLTALLFAGRAGTSLTSEIGLMKSTEQLTAMQMMAVDPLRHVVAPRFLGGFIAMPLLAATFSVIGLFGAQLIGVQQMGVDVGAFWSQTQNAVDLRDVTEGIVKSLVFGVGLQPRSRSTRVITASPRPKAWALRPRAPWSLPRCWCCCSTTC